MFFTDLRPQISQYKKIRISATEKQKIQYQRCGFFHIDTLVARSGSFFTILRQNLVRNHGKFHIDTADMPRRQKSHYIASKRERSHHLNARTPTTLPRRLPKREGDGGILSNLI